MMNAGTVNTGTAQRNMRKEPDMVSCWCRKSFRTVRGLRIHQTRKGCRRMADGATHPNQVMQRTEVVHTTEGNAEDDDNPVNTHSVIDESTAEPPDVRRPPINWPAMSEAEKWSAMDEDICGVLSNSLKGDCTKKLQHLADTIYHYGVEKFGTKDRGSKPAGSNLSRRQLEIHNIRKEIRSLTKQWKAARLNGNLLECEGLDKLRDDHRNRLKSLRKAERAKRKRKERERKRTKFFKNPFEFAKGLFEKARSGVLNVPKEELEEHLKNTYSDPRREDPMPHIEGLVRPTEPTTPFDLSEPKLNEMDKFLKKARSASSPGHNGVPYKVYKKCDGLRKILWKLLRVVWRNDIMPVSWCQAEGVYIPKEQDSVGIGSFRPI